MSKLEKYLSEWAQLGLITQEQVGRIRQHESSKAESSWILSGFLILGVAIIGIGLISMIASNWHQIPDFVKLGTDFAILFGLIYYLVQSWQNQKTLVYEVLLVFFMLCCLASIGLISQVYHTGGKLYQAFFLWSVICLLPALTARKTFAPFFWIGLTCTGVLLAAYGAAYQMFFYRSYGAVYLTLPLICASAVVFGKKYLPENGWTRAFQIWLPISGLLALFMGEIGMLVRFEASSGVSLFVPAYLLCLLLIAGIWQSTHYLKTQKVTLTAALGVFMCVHHLDLIGEKHEVLNAAGTILTLGLFAIYLASEKRRTLFQWLLFLVGARFLVLYFQVIGGLALTGFGLIISGLVVIGITVLWNKYRKTLAEKAEGWLQ